VIEIEFAAGGALNIEQLPDPLQRLARYRRIGLDMNVVKVAPHMGPASNLGYGRWLSVRGFIERTEARIAVGLQEAVEVGEARARMLAFAIGE
jgi:hypothetical protein